MRVLQVTNTYPPGDISGVGALAQELAQALAAAGHRSTVLTRRAALDDPDALPTGGPKILFPLVAAGRFVGLARRDPPDVVHVHESDGAVVALVLRAARAAGFRWARARLVATLQVSYRRERLAVRPVRAGTAVVSRPTPSERVFAWGRAPLLSLLGRLTGRLADGVVAPSWVTAGELEADYGLRKVAVIPNGVPPGEPGGDPAAADGAGPVVLYAGRLRTRKAVAVLIAALPRVVAAVPGVRLVLAGDGEQRPRLEAQVRALGLQGSVEFLGSRPRAAVQELYRRAQVFCLPSTYEGFPVAILEAMAAGLPVVSTVTSGIPEAVEHGVSGLLVPPEDDAALAAALVRLLADPAARRAMGMAARRRVADRFGREQVARAYLELYAAASAGR